MIRLLAIAAIVCAWIVGAQAEISAIRSYATGSARLQTAYHEAGAFELTLASANGSVLRPPTNFTTLLQLSVDITPVVFRVVLVRSVVWVVYRVPVDVQPDTSYSLRVRIQGADIGNSPLAVALVQSRTLPGDPAPAYEHLFAAFVALVSMFLGSLTTAILLEQAIASPTRDKRYYVTLAGSAVPFALCAVWASICMAGTQIVFYALPNPTFQVTYVCYALAPICVLVVLGFVLAGNQRYHTMKRIHPTDELRSYDSHIYGSSSALMEPLQMSFGDQLWRTTGAFLRRVWHALCMLKRAYGIYSFAGGVAIQGAYVVGHLCLAQAMLCEAQPQYTGGLFVALVIQGCAAQAALHCFMHLLYWRNVGVVVMAVGMGTAHLVFHQSIRWTYAPTNYRSILFSSVLESLTDAQLAYAVETSSAPLRDIAYPSAVLTAYYVRFICVITAAPFCFLSLNMLVNRMKVSWAKMDAQLKLVVLERNKVQERLDRQKRKTEQIQELMQLLNRVRPACSETDSVTVYQLTVWRASWADESTTAFELLLAETTDYFTHPELHKASLDDILNHRVCIELFKDQCRLEQSMENVEFCLCVNQYKRDYDQGEFAHGYLETLLRTHYVSEEGLRAINIPGGLRNTILKTTKRSASMFDAAQNEIMKMMRGDSFGRFKKTAGYKICCFILSHN